MHFTKLLSCNFVSDGYNGMSIQIDITLEKKTGYTGASVARTSSPVCSRTPWINLAKYFVKYL